MESTQAAHSAACALPCFLLALKAQWQVPETGHGPHRRSFQDLRQICMSHVACADVDIVFIRLLEHRTSKLCSRETRSPGRRESSPPHTLTAPRITATDRPSHHARLLPFPNPARPIPHHPRGPPHQLPLIAPHPRAPSTLSYDS
eukprot:scaffold15986_cov142-Isochrysis_galbana.AAC.3